MKAILSLWRHHYLQRVGIFLIAAALIVGMVACEGGPTEYSLTVAVCPVGGGTAIDLTDASPYEAGTLVDIETVAAAGYQFVNWIPSVGGTCADPNDPTTTFTMPAQNAAVIANFEPESGGCLDFEDLLLGTQYDLWDTFVEECVYIAVQPFQLADGGWTDNYAMVGNTTTAGGSGQEMMVNNVNLAFAYDCSWEGLSLFFGETGGNLNIEINGDFRNFTDFPDINGDTIGGVDVGAFVTARYDDHEYMGILILSGEIDSFAIGGQELWIDHVCITDSFEPTNLCVDFEDLLLGALYYVGDTFVEECAVIAVQPFQWDIGNWTDGGYAMVGNLTYAGGSGQEMKVNNVNLAFVYGCSWESLSLLFGETGGNLNIEINGDFRNFTDFPDIHGDTIGGVDVDVLITSSFDHEYMGILTLSGEINSFAIGGQELWIDHVCMNVTS